MSYERVNFSRRRLLVEQIVVVVVLGCGMKVDTMWHVPQFYLFLPSMGWLCRDGVFELIECSHSLPALHSGLQLLIIIIYYLQMTVLCRKQSDIRW